MSDNEESSDEDEPEMLSTPISRRYKRTLRHFFHGKLFHSLLTILVTIDLGIVLTDIIIVMVHCTHIPHHLEQLMHTLLWVSVAILGTFFIELCLQMYAFGRQWFKSCLHVFDFVIVVATLILEIVLHGHPKAELVVGLLPALRLWRLVRVIHVTTEAMDLQHEIDRDKLLEEVHALKKKIKAYKKLNTNTNAKLKLTAKQAVGVESTDNDKNDNGADDTTSH